MGLPGTEERPLVPMGKKPKHALHMRTRNDTCACACAHTRTMRTLAPSSHAKPCKYPPFPVLPARCRVPCDVLPCPASGAHGIAMSQH